MACAHSILSPVDSNKIRNHICISIATRPLYKLMQSIYVKIGFKLRNSMALACMYTLYSSGFLSVFYNQSDVHALIELVHLRTSYVTIL